ncbi:MAG: zinc-binding dehydrogenase [Lentisphaeria bacterium]|nr:zinc-binding dehydrogenase [Lentisphaeria bacterium]
MKGALSDGKGKVWVDEVPMPEIGDYECLCKTDACATCTGTDKKLIMGEMSWAKPEHYPAILGHESVGTVIKIGKKVRYIKEGMRILRPAAWYPGENKHGITSFMGGFAEYGIVTDLQALKEDDPEAKPSAYTQYQQILPDDLEISPADATMLITLKEIYSFIRDLNMPAGKTAVVLGAGAVGTAMCFFAKLAGLKVAVAARRDAPLTNCREAGADFTVNTAKEDLCTALREWTNNCGVDFILDASGAFEMISSAAQALAEKGSLCTYASGGTLKERFAELSLPVRWQLVSCPPAEASAHDFLISMVRMKLIPFHLFYDRVMPLEDFPAGMAEIFDKKSIKTVFTM